MPFLITLLWDVCLTVACRGSRLSWEFVKRRESALKQRDLVMKEEPSAHQLADSLSLTHTHTHTQMNTHTHTHEQTHIDSD